MTITHNITRNIFLTTAALTLVACQTTGSATNKDEMLFAGIEDQRATETQAAPSRDEDSTTCLRFYANATQFAAQPQGSGFAKSLLKTVAIGTLSGVASGGVAAVGISSAFVEAALIGTTSQVVYQTADQGWDKAFGKPKVDPVTEISSAASEVGCPPPSDAALKASESLASDNLVETESDATE